MNKFLLIHITILLISTGCKKENPASEPTFPILPPPPAVIAPEISTDRNIYLLLPTDSCILQGKILSSTATIVRYSWKKVSGPASYSIVTPDSLTTKVRNLQKGTYVFELAVTTSSGSTSTSSASVFVPEKGPGTNELLFKDLEWECPMGCSLVIEKFNSFVLVPTSFKVYIKPDNSSNWIEVIHESQASNTTKYTYSFHSDALLIYANDENDTPDVKVVY